MTERESMRLVARWEVSWSDRSIFTWYELRHDGMCYRFGSDNSSALAGRKFASDRTAIEHAEAAIDQANAGYKPLGLSVRRVDDRT
jgi:hypothetical protein